MIFRTLFLQTKYVLYMYLVFIDDSTSLHIGLHMEIVLHIFVNTTDMNYFNYKTIPVHISCYYIVFYSGKQFPLGLIHFLSFLLLGLGLGFYDDLGISRI